MDAQILSGKKVLIIAYGFPPIAHAGVYRTMRFSRYLPAHGWKPTVITIREMDDIHSDRSLLKRIPEDIRIHRTNTIDVWRAVQRHLAKEARKKSLHAAQDDAENSGGAFRAAQRIKSLFLKVLLRLFSIPDHMLLWVPFAVAEGATLMRKEKFDIIYTSSPPHSEHLAGLLLSKMFHVPWVADFRDPLVGNFTTQNLPRMELWLHGVLESILVRLADAVVVVTRHHQEAMRKRYPALSSKFVVIRNGFDPALFENIEPSRFDKFTVLFAGTLYGIITPDFFIRGLVKWLDEKDRAVREDIQVLFYGMGCEKAGRLARELGIGDVVKSCGPIPQAEIIGKQKGADLLLFIIGPDKGSAGIVASKLYEYMAVNRPILAIVPEGESLEILRSYGKFTHVPHEDYGALMRSLDEAYGTYVRTGRTGPEPDNVSSESRYDAAVQVKDLIRVFHETSLARSAEPPRAQPFMS